MAIATYATQPLTGTINQESVSDALVTALDSAGWGQPLDDYSDGSRHLIYSRYAAAGHLSTLIHIRVGTNSIQASLGTGWDDAAKTMEREGTLIYYNAWTANPGVFHVLSAGDEFSGAIWQQGTVITPILFFAPEMSAQWWDRALWAWGFIPTDVALAGWRPTAASPFTGWADFRLPDQPYLNAINSVTNRRDSVSGLLLLCPNNEGIAARSSNELGAGVCSGLARFDALIDDSFTPAREHLVLNPASGGFIVRVA